MRGGKVMKKYYERYKHAIPAFVYMAVYFVWFAYLERTIKTPETVIHMKWDDLIPFCEVFVVPYYLWFAYVAVTVLYLMFTNKQDYYRTCTFLFTGMTVFLIVSTLWPNGHHLRPSVMPRDNIFTTLVSAMYRADTPTNLWPSIHVYNSIGAHLAVLHNEKLRKNKGIRYGSLVLCLSIIVSTVLIKQHSCFDVITGILMGAIMYVVVYQLDIIAIHQAHQTAKRRRMREV